MRFVASNGATLADISLPTLADAQSVAQMQQMMRHLILVHLLHLVFIFAQKMQATVVGVSPFAELF